MNRRRTPTVTFACLLAALFLGGCADAPGAQSDAAPQAAARGGIEGEGTSPGAVDGGAETAGAAASAPATAAEMAGAPAAGAAASAQATAAGSAGGGPPLGRYVCRQYTTTMGYLTLHPGGEYETSGVRGAYRYDPASGAMAWQGGSYDEWGWAGFYEHVTRPAGDGRPDEDIIRLEGDGLKIDCYRMAEE